MKKWALMYVTLDIVQSFIAVKHSTLRIWFSLPGLGNSLIEWRQGEGVILYLKNVSTSSIHKE